MRAPLGLAPEDVVGFRQQQRPAISASRQSRSTSVRPLLYVPSCTPTFISAPLKNFGARRGVSSATLLPRQSDRLLGLARYRHRIPAALNSRAQYRAALRGLGCAAPLVLLAALGFCFVRSTVRSEPSNLMRACAGFLRRCCRFMAASASRPPCAEQFAFGVFRHAQRRVWAGETCRSMTLRTSRAAHAAAAHRVRRCARQTRRRGVAVAFGRPCREPVTS